MEGRLSAPITEAEKRVLELIARGVPVPEVLSAVCTLVEHAAVGGFAAAYVLSGRRLFLEAGPSVPAEMRESLAGGVIVGEGKGSLATGAAVHAGQRVTVDDVTVDPRWADHRGVAATHGFQSVVAVPIVGERDELHGAVTLYLRRPLETAARAITLLEALVPLAALAIERGLVLDALRESEERYRTLVDGLSAVIFQTGAGGKLSFISAPFAAAGGVTPASAIGHELADFFHPDDRGRLMDAERSILAGARHEAHLELRVVAPGEQRWLACNMRARRGEDGAVLGLGGILTDVTERKALEAQLQIADRMASMGTLVAGVAHEINNPLASVMLNLDFLTRELSSALLEPNILALDRLLDPLRAASEGVERVRDLVRNLKTFSRADDRRRLVDVRQVLESTMRMAMSEIRHRARVGREFREVPPVVASEADLGQVFLNLMVNAAQAIPDGHIDDHEIRLVTRTDAGGRVVIEVRDTGGGITPEHLDHIFDPFFTTKPIGVGTGLGLSICHRLVTQMGGEITVESEVGVGTVFRVNLPPGLKNPETGRAISQPLPPVRRGHLLVVDDEPFIGEAVRRLLSPLHEVSVVTSSEDALARIDAGASYDVILCDVMMPRMNGVQLHAEVARISQRLADRMLFITGGAFSPTVRQFLESVPGRILEKPFDAKSLLRAVQERIT